MAIRPADSGVHYFSIFNSADDNYSPSAKLSTLHDNEHCQCQYKVAAPRVAGTQTVCSWTQGNPSSYLLDAGLWTACKESRKIIMKHFNMQHWNKVRREFEQCGCVWKFYYEHKDKPAIVITHHNGEDLHLMVNPERDLFCLDPQILDFTIEWDTLLCGLPFSCIYTGYGPLSHIAVEFDPSWNVGLPRDCDENWDWNPTPGVCFDDLLEEGTPRGFIARAAEACAIRAFYKDEYPFFWLIDRGIRRETPSRRNPNFPLVEFSDGNHKYIETTSKDMTYDTYEEYCQTAEYFLYQLGFMGDGHLTYIYHWRGWDTGDTDGFCFEVQDCLGVLAYS